MNFKSKRWQIFLLVSLIVLSLGIFVKFAIGTDEFSKNIRSMFLGTFSQNPFKKQSEVEVSLVDSKINLNFEIIGEDKPQFAQFIKNWFNTDEEIKSLSFGIDEKLSAALKSNLPVELNMTITDKSLNFNSQLIQGLQNALIKKDIEFASGSGKLNAQFTDSSKYQINLENPADLVDYATSSGVLTASSKLAPLFKTLPKVATIELNVNGKNISGQIKLK